MDAVQERGVTCAVPSGLFVPIACPDLGSSHAVDGSCDRPANALAPRSKRRLAAAG